MRDMNDQYEIFKYNTRLRILEEQCKKGNWSFLCGFVPEHEEFFEEVFSWFDQIPDDEVKYDLAILSYIQGGDHYEVVRKAVKSLKDTKYNRIRRSQQWYQECKEAGRESLFVYRAGSESISSCKKRLSWTLDLSVAMHFLDEYHPHVKKGKWKHGQIYGAEIRLDDVIAYVDLRGEQEIIQYNSIYDIQKVSVYLQ